MAEVITINGITSLLANLNETFEFHNCRQGHIGPHLPSCEVDTKKGMELNKEEIQLVIANLIKESPVESLINEFEGLFPNEVEAKLLDAIHKILKHSKPNNMQETTNEVAPNMTQSIIISAVYNALRAKKKGKPYLTNRQILEAVNEGVTAGFASELSELPTLPGLPL